MGTSKTKVEAATPKSMSVASPERLGMAPEHRTGPMRSARLAAPTPPNAPTAPSDGGGGSAGPRATRFARASQARASGILQRQIGNRRALSMFQALQPKLQVNTAGDVYEQEADLAASRIVSGRRIARLSAVKPMSDAAPAKLRRTSAECGDSEMIAGTPVADADRADNGEAYRGSDAVQRSSASMGDVAIDPMRAEWAIGRTGSGNPLAPPMRAEMERGFGTDLSHVRVHTGAGSQDAARAIQARAFTKGADIYLGHGESALDRRLMAHEVAHTIQQRGDRGSQEVQRLPAPGTGAEAESSGEPASPIGQGEEGPQPAQTGGLGGGDAGAGGETQEEEEIHVPSFDLGADGGCPQLVKQEPMFGGSAGQESGEVGPAASGLGTAAEGGPEAEVRAGGIGGPRSSVPAREQPSTGGGATMGSDPFGELLGLLPGLGLAGLAGPGAFAFRLFGQGGSALWHRLPWTIRARVVNRAIDLAIAGAAFVPRVTYEAVFGILGRWFRAGLMAFLRRIRVLGDRLKVELFEKYLSITLGLNLSFLWGYVRGIFAGFFVDGLIGIIQMVIDIVCLVGKVPQLITALGRFFGAFPEHMLNLAMAIMQLSRALDAASAHALGEVRALFREPRRVIGLLNTMGAASESVGTRMGEMVADGLIRFWRLPAERIGSAAGRLVGMALFEAVVAALTSGGGAAATAGKVAARMAVKLFSAIGQRLLAIGRFIMDTLRMLMPYVRRAAELLTHFFRGVAERLHDAMSAVAALFARLCRSCRVARSYRCRVPRRQRRRPRRRQRRRASALTWTGNPRSAEYGHSFSSHFQRTDGQMWARARTDRMPIGRFSNPQSIVDAERAARGHLTGWVRDGHYIQEIEMPNVGEVFLPDGVTRVTTHRVRIIRDAANPYGKVITSYPVLTRNIKNRLRRRGIRIMR
jgi:hypothetical protein